MRASPCLALLAVIGCGGVRPDSPHPIVAAREAPAPAMAAPSCASWPLQRGCTTSLARGPDMLCAMTATRAFCWGPGAKSRARDGGEVLSLSIDEARDLGVAATPPWKMTGDAASASLSVGDAHFDLREVHVEPGDVGKIARGLDHACLLAKAQLFCEGEELARGAGDGHGRVPLGPVSDAVALDDTTCALSDGTVWCWGSTTHFPPGAVAADHRKIVAFSAGLGETCLLADDETVACWSGRRWSDVPALHGARQIVSVDAYNCARFDGGRVGCVVGGRLEQRAELEPAKRLLANVPCAILEDGRLRCVAWKPSQGIREEDLIDFQALTIATGAAHAAAAVATLERPTVCVATATGVACTGVTSLSWDPQLGPSGIPHDRHYGPVAAGVPVRITGPKDVVDIGPSGCMRTRNGAMYMLVPRFAANKKKVEIAAVSVPGAEPAARLLDADECVVVRDDESRLLITRARIAEQDEGEWRTTAAHVPDVIEQDIEPPLVTRLDALPDDGLGVAREVRRFGVGSRIRCALAPNGRPACRHELRGDQGDGAVFDPLAHAATPVQVIPARE